MKKLVLLRHGESQWNLENRFTGWTNVDLTQKGAEEAKKAGELLNQEGIEFDVVHTSLLKRANRTMEICIDEMGLSKVSKKFDWRLNERHYGALQGLNKAETAEKHGDEQVLIWRRSYDILLQSWIITMKDILGLINYIQKLQLTYYQIQRASKILLSVLCPIGLTSSSLRLKKEKEY